MCLSSSIVVLRFSYPTAVAVALAARLSDFHHVAAPAAGLVAPIAADDFAGTIAGVTNKPLFWRVAIHGDGLKADGATT